MLDFLNPWSGSYTFTYDEEEYRDRMESKLNRVRDGMDTGNEGITHAKEKLADQEGKFIEATLEKLDKLVTKGQVTEIYSYNVHNNHIVAFENYLSDQSKQKYDITKELDPEALTPFNRAFHPYA